MHIREETLDDLLFDVLDRLLKINDRVAGSRGSFSEITGVLLELTNPLARLSRTEKKTHVFSSLGELLWYLSGSNDLAFITYYLRRYLGESDDEKTVYGAYGPRLLKMAGQHDQISNVIKVLQAKRTSKRAVIQLFDAADLAQPHREVPCTCTIQLMVRADKVHMLTNMRSNDAYLGLPHDVFAFTMLQELIARSLDVAVGSYKHFVGSLHLYEDHRTAAEEYLGEGFQARVGVAMPSMPSEEPWSSIRVLSDAESRIRLGETLDVGTLSLAPYWQDLVRLLQVFRNYKDGDDAKIAELMKRMAHPVFKSYIEQKRKTARKKESPRT